MPSSAGCHQGPRLCSGAADVDGVKDMGSGYPTTADVQAL
jgi:hypothetical protein